jgi:hypothetical protein
MLRWVFRREGATLTCEVDANRQGWEIFVVPHWNVGASTIERFPTMLRALERQAEIAYELREAGWTVVDHAPVMRRSGTRAEVTAS